MLIPRESIITAAAMTASIAGTIIGAKLAITAVANPIANPAKSLSVLFISSPSKHSDKFCQDNTLIMIHIKLISA